MLRESSFLIKLKASLDVVFLGLIVIATRFQEFQSSFFSQSLFIVVIVNILGWLFIARAFGL
jgi:hypothetical protein